MSESEDEERQVVVSDDGFQADSSVYAASQGGGDEGLWEPVRPAAVPWSPSASLSLAWVQVCHMHKLLLSNFAAELSQQM